MNIKSDLFDAFLKCPTKCYLRSTGQAGAGNAYAGWAREQNDAYRKEAVQRLVTAAEGEVAVTTPDAANLKTATWQLAVDLPLESETMAASLHAVERVPPQGRGKAAQFVPIRFVFRNKLTKDDRLLLAFDALVLSQVLGRETSLGKIIHGDDHTTLKVKVASLLGTVRKLTGNMSALLAAGSPPDLVLNRHCGECEFRDGCRQKAVEKDDLSLLGGMSAKERQKLRSKGIFTVTQLSYTFRPRRRPKRLRDKREKYHHSLKALAIREKKIHIVGSPELKIEGTPLYLDVEGLPDRDFYYLIGLRIGSGESAVQHSLWADRVEEERGIWRQFLDILETIEKPVLLHYGSYETTFLKAMVERYGELPAESVAAQAIRSAINVLAIIFTQVYFPAYTNGLKGIAGYLGFYWSDSDASGLKAILWRHEWEATRKADLRQQLISYNAEDCQALQGVSLALAGLGASSPDRQSETEPHPAVVHTEFLPHQTMWPPFSSPLKEFEHINKLARWDYQRERVYVRSDKRLRKKVHRRSNHGLVRKINKRIVIADNPRCPKCDGAGCRENASTKVLYDLRFNTSGLRRWVVEYKFKSFWCQSCRRRYGMPASFWPGTKFGRNLLAYVVYCMVESLMHQRCIQRTLERLFSHRLNSSQIHGFKSRVAGFYQKTREDILERIVNGPVVHVDETKANVRGKAAYVWVFANLREVVYLYSASR